MLQRSSTSNSLNSSKMNDDTSPFLPPPPAYNLGAPVGITVQQTLPANLIYWEVQPSPLLQQPSPSSSSSAANLAQSTTVRVHGTKGNTAGNDDLPDRDGASLFYREVEIPASDPALDILKSNDYVKTHDSGVASNIHTLANYFFYHLRKKPRLLVHIRGFHEECMGRNETETHPKRKVTDFEMTIDASNYISANWDRVSATSPVIPGPQNTVDDEEQYLHDRTWKSALEEFVTSEHPLKEIRLTKEIEWDFANLETSILLAIRQMGYQDTVKVRFETKGQTVSALSPSNFSRVANNVILQALSILTCLCVIVGPAVWISTPKPVRVYAYYPAVAGARTFFERNIGIIVAAVVSRKIGAKLQAA
ncbi:hypothetical protein HDU84_008708 [Entophlyctis sp. JEL0112]|nr:hypothetical protein HDU84_008708 [Entophlyctis sp. JEL0112]